MQMHENFTPVTRFVSEVIPDILRNLTYLSVLVSTYNDVSNYEPGEIKTEKFGLKITLACGELSTGSLLTVLVAASLVDTAEAYVKSEKAYDAMSSNAQKATERTVEQSAIGPGTQLVIVYAGLSAWKKALEYTSALRKKYPSAMIAVLTCDCDLAAKTPDLAARLSDRTLNWVIVSPNCGGYGDLEKIIDRIKDVWPTQ